MRKLVSVCSGVGMFFAMFLAIQVPPSRGMKCTVQLDYPEKTGDISYECYTSNKYNLTNFPAFNWSTPALEQYNYDDNCNTQCKYKKLDLLTPEGSLKKDQAPVYYKTSELTKDILDKATNVWNQCWDEAVKIGKEKGFNNCKMLSLHHHCNMGRVRGRSGYENILEKIL